MYLRDGDLVPVASIAKEFFGLRYGHFISMRGGRRWGMGRETYSISPLQLLHR
jgi:hypothetical protein